MWLENTIITELLKINLLTHISAIVLLGKLILKPEHTLLNSEVVLSMFGLVTLTIL